MAEEDESDNLPGSSSLLCQPNLVGEEEEELDNLPRPYLQLTMTSRLYPSAISSLILIKWAHVQSESMASITIKSPPTKVIKAEPLSPDHNSLCKAMRVSGEANLDTMQCMSLFNALFIAHLIILLLYQVFKNTFYQTNFYPIPTFPIKCILKNPDLYVFDLDTKKKVMVLHPGQLWFSSSNTFVGAGAFKTAYTATLVLLCPTALGIGSCSSKAIVLK